MAISKISMQELFQAGVHYGHLTRCRNPKMQNYIYGVSNQVNIIDLEKTVTAIQESLKLVEKIITHGGKILFVGTKRAARDIIVESAKKCSMPYVNYRWLGGMLTNYKTIKQSIRRLEELHKMQEDGTLKHLTKKENLTIARELLKLENSLGGIKDMRGLPDALFIIDVGHEATAVKEANRIKIPVIGIVDTNCDPDGVSNVIPGNDDAMRAISLYCKYFVDTILATKDEKSNNTLSAKYGEDTMQMVDQQAYHKKLS
jgi:small subunit ribosomal protein S2